jgi:hypothetical protein
MTLFNLSGYVDRYSTDTITVSRFAVDTFDSQGRALPRSASTFTCLASVQPAASNLNRDDERGFRAHDTIEILSSTALQMRDRVSVPGRGNFEVDHVNEFSPLGGYTSVLATRLHASEPGA